MPDFEITLKNEKTKSYKTSLIVFIFLILISFLFLAYVSKENYLRKTFLLAAECIAISMLLDFFIKNKNRVDFRSAAILFSLFFYFKTHYYWLGITVIGISILYRVAIRTLRIYITSSSVSYPSLPRTDIKWELLNNVILKDGLLTIDLKNNKFMQQAIDEKKTSINEQEFNDFCQQQLNK